MTSLLRAARPERTTKATAVALLLLSHDPDGTALWTADDNKLTTLQAALRVPSIILAEEVVRRARTTAADEDTLSDFLRPYDEHASFAHERPPPTPKLAHAENSVSSPSPERSPGAMQVGTWPPELCAIGTIGAVGNVAREPPALPFADGTEHVHTPEHSDPLDSNLTEIDFLGDMLCP